MQISKKLKLVAIVVLAAAAALFMMSGVAFANYGPHGSFDKDTDGCAGCHRAHTSISAVSWTGSNGTKSALLIGSNTENSVKSFCYTCHGSSAPGAATDVSAGMLDAQAGNSTLYGNLNGGGFEEFNGDSFTSRHDMPSAASPTPTTAFGGLPNNDGGAKVSMDCSSCHDPHGSSNYRLLNDKITLGGGAWPTSTVTVGGYDNFAGFDPNPQPFVVSNEEGYPLGGFRLHVTVPNYKPDYTTARYARPVDSTSTPGTPDVAKGISGWCAGCHTTYNTQSPDGQAAYNAADGLGDEIRHRHPVNVPLGNFAGDRPILTTDTATGINAAWGDNLDIPLEHNPASEAVTTASPNNQKNTMGDYIGCLTCHRAHGTSATMAGFAAGIGPNGSVSQLSPTMQPGNPDASSALLRANNRGVCERCHNK
jgi:hypothetical protein